MKSEKIKIITPTDGNPCPNVGKFEQMIPGVFDAINFPNVPSKQQLYPLFVNFKNDPKGSIKPDWLRDAAIHALGLSADGTVIAEILSRLDKSENQISVLNNTVLSNTTLINFTLNSINNLSAGVNEKFNEITPLLKSISSNVTALSNVVKTYDKKIENAISVSNIAYDTVMQAALSINTALSVSESAMLLATLAGYTAASMQGKIDELSVNLSAISADMDVIATEDTLGKVKSSNDPDKIKVNPDGTMSINSVGFSKIYADVEDIIIGDTSDLS